MWGQPPPAVRSSSARLDLVLLHISKTRARHRDSEIFTNAKQNYRLRFALS
jgi:hypothetical protein